MAKNNGGQAFPMLEQHSDRDGDHVTQWFETDGGMSLRDYFAAKAMALVPAQAAHNTKDNESWSRYTARRAYELADAMIEESER